MLSASMSNQGLNASSTGGGCHAPRQGRDCGSLLMQTVRMTRQKILMKKNLLLLLSLVILGSTALVLCTRAQACKLTPEAYDLSAYLSSDQPNKVVFQAEVESEIMDAKTKNGSKIQIIRFKPSRWWLGHAREKVTARGVTGSAPGTSCAGMFDFTVKTREVWLIAGYEENGVIYPSPNLSRLLTNRRLPADAQKALQAVRNGIKSK